MATVEEIAAFRLLIGVPLSEAPYTDAELSDRIDAAESLPLLAASIWREKAATYAGLVDVAESGSSRRMSQLYDQALKMAAHFDGQAAVPDTSSGTGVRFAKLTRR